jgi:hypothetical protein
MSSTWTAPERESLTKREYAVLHGFSDRSLDRAIAEGRLRAAKVLGAWRITREDGDRFARGLPPLPGPAPTPIIRRISGRGL